jgi:hypothetical protein
LVTTPPPYPHLSIFSPPCPQNLLDGRG